MNLEKLGKEFWQNGYLVLHDFFEAGLMEDMDRVIRRHFRENPEFRHEEEFLSRSRTEVIPWFPQNPDLPEYSADMAMPFDRLEAGSRLRQLTQMLLGEDWANLYSMVMFSGKGTAGQAWHQDCPPEDTSRYNLNRLVYTRDLTGDIGGQTVVMPGSHRVGELPAGEPHEDLPGQVVLNPRKGTLVLLHGHTWHRVLPITGAFRFSTNYRVCPQGTPADITDICIYRNMRYCFSTNSVIEERQPPA
jgi:ectoine hydroxylase-related dioxygenase (phytanoyl-CoA dioxygenase family)